MAADGITMKTCRQKYSFTKTRCEKTFAMFNRLFPDTCQENTSLFPEEGGKNSETKMKREDSCISTERYSTNQNFLQMQEDE